MVRVFSGMFYAFKTISGGECLNSEDSPRGKNFAHAEEIIRDIREHAEGAKKQDL
jgi:hypothetical protein